MTSLVQAYEQACQQLGYQQDPAQQVAVKSLQRVYMELVARHNRRKHLLQKFTSRKPVKGLYMWGGVGRGKTFLMDLFYAQLPFQKKMRMHFNRFMQQVHRDLAAMENTKDPLQQLAKSFAKKVDVICFDEFLVVDIADAMVLGLLFESLFSEGVALVATSNAAPENLYKDGLQREQFLPAIRAIEANVEVLNVDAGVDHRGRQLTLKQRYFTPLKAEEEFMRMHFDILNPGGAFSESDMRIANREIEVIRYAPEVAWFDFKEICCAPRGQADYIALAERFRTILISHVPQMRDNMDDHARRFISLVDEFYDSGVNLILSAMVPIDQLYQGKRLAFEFERTKSRLHEMQSEEYSQQHG